MDHVMIGVGRSDIYLSEVGSFIVIEDEVVAISNVISHKRASRRHVCEMTNE